MTLPNSFWGWAGLFLLAALVVIMFVVIPALVAASRTDDDVMGNLQYEEVELPTFACVRCGKLDTHDRLLALSGEGLVHRGGCPGERKRATRRAQG